MSKKIKILKLPRKLKKFLLKIEHKNKIHVKYKKIYYFYFFGLLFKSSTYNESNTEYIHFTKNIYEKRIKNS